ncbi:MAG: DUF2269 domain-containing protein [Thermoleophilia bacterium]|nr:DUF2269 domain-containing protein [Thermoleophilia bacterium]
MTPGFRKALLTTHVVVSVGWLGAVAAVLAVAIVGLVADGEETVRGAYLVLEPAAWFVLVPFALASLLTGIVQSLAGPWGLFRHYWVLFKLAINVLATVVLLAYTQTLDFLAHEAAAGALEELRTPSVVIHASAALVLLLVATTLAVVKPRGRTPWARR